jgi:DNA polymerase III subunit delta'
MISIEQFAWLRLPYAATLASYKTGTLPHALLFYGAKGNSVNILAEAVAEAILCHELTDKSCGGCGSCSLLQHQTHPDLYYVLREDAGIIGVNDVRNLMDVCSQTATLGGARVILLQHAERLNRHAANALLKILEEPPAGVYFIMTSAHVSHLLPTIRSRLRYYFVPAPEASELLAVLPASDQVLASEVIVECDYSYDASKQMLENPDYQTASGVFKSTLLHVLLGKQIATALSQSVSEVYLSNMFIYIVQWLQDSIRYSMQLAPVYVWHKNQLLSMPLVEGSGHRLYVLYDQALQLWYLLQYNNSVNKTLLLDDYMIGLRRYYNEVCT